MQRRLFASHHGRLGRSWIPCAGRGPHPPAWLLQGLAPLLCLALLVGPARAAEPGFEDLHVRGGGSGRAGEPVKGDNPGGIAADAPDVTWAFVPEGRRAEARAKDFWLHLDTPAFENFSARTPGDTEWNGGTCYGVNLFTLVWFQTFVVPLSNQGVTDFIFSSNGINIRDQMGVPGPVNHENLDRYRLKRYSTPAARRNALYRNALRFQDDQGYAFNAGSTLSPEATYRSLKSDIETESSQLGMVALFRRQRESAHSLLVYRIESGKARATNGTEVEAKKVLFYDPNFVVDGRPRDEMYLIYFPRARKWALPAPWVAHYQRADRSSYQVGPYVDRSQMQFENVNSRSARWSRSLGNWWQGDVDQGTEFQ